MSSLKFFFVLSFIFTATAYKISTKCVNVCKSDLPVRCQTSCDLDNSIASALRAIYSDDVVNTCLTPCHCDKNQYKYLNDHFCKVLQSFAVKNVGKDCQCNLNTWSNNLSKWSIEEPGHFVEKNIIDYLVKREGSPRKRIAAGTPAAGTASNPWENWCKKQCSEGLGGSACYCDIIP